MIHLDPLGPTGQIRSMATSPDERWLAVGTDTAQILIYAMPSGRLTRVFPSEPWVDGLGFDSDGLLWSSNPDRDLCAWDPDTGQCVHTLSTREVGGPRLILRRGERLVVLLGKAVWLFEGGAQIGAVGPYGAQVDDCELHPDGERLLMCFAPYSKHHAQWVEWRTGDILKPLHGVDGSHIRILRFLSKNRVYLKTDSTAWVTGWPLSDDIATSNTTAIAAPHASVYDNNALYWCRTRWLGRFGLEDGVEAWEKKHYDQIHQVALAGGKLLTAAGHRQWIGVRDRDTGALERVLPAGTGSKVPIMAFDPSGRLLIAFSNDGRIQRWDTQTHTLHDQFDPTSLGDPDNQSCIVPTALGFDPQGVMWAYAYGTIVRWTDDTQVAPTRQTVEDLPDTLPQQKVKASTPAGATLLNSDSNTHAVWSPHTGEVLGTLPGDDDSYESNAQLSPDGTHALFEHDGTELQVWRVGSTLTLRARMTWDHPLLGWVPLSNDQVLLWLRRHIKPTEEAPGGFLPVTWALWDIARQTLTRWKPAERDDPTDAATPLVDLPRDRVILVGDQRIWIVRLSKPGLERVIDAAVEHDRLTAHALDPTGRTLATATWGNVIRLWDLETGENTATYIMTCDGSWQTRTKDGASRCQLSSYARRSP